MRRRAFLAAVVSAALIAWLWGGEEADSPSPVVVSYINAARTGDFRTAARYWDPRRLEEIKKLYGSMKAYWDGWKEWEKDDAVSGAEVVRERTDELQKKATVFFKVFYGDGRAWNCTADMYRTAEGWKIEETRVVSLSPE